MTHLSSRKNHVIPKAYSWGSGFFRDVADIRRRVHTAYYVRTELRTLLEPMLGKPCPTFLDQVFDEIENPCFFIDAKRYEEITAYLWQRSRETFPAEIDAWERVKDQRVREDARRLLNTFGDRLAPERLLKPEGIRRAVLTSCWASLPDAAEVDQILARCLLDNALDREGKSDGINVPIDFTPLLAKQVFDRPCRLVVLPGDLASVVCDLMLYGQSLLDHWTSLLARRTDADRQRNGQVRVTFLVNEQLTPRNNNLLRLLNPTVQNMSDLLELPEFSRLRAFRDAGVFEVRAFRSEFPGTVLTDLDDETAAMLAEADCVVATGEPNNLTLNGMGVPCFRVAPIRDFPHIFLTGIKLDRESFQFPRFSILYAPAGVLPAVDSQPDFPTRLTAKQFFDLFRVLPDTKWNALVEQARDGGNILQLAEQSATLSSEERSAVAAIAGPSQCERHQHTSDVLARFGGSYTRVADCVNNFRQRVMHVIHFPERAAGTSSRLRLGVRFAQSLMNHEGRAKTLLTFDDLLAAEPDALFGFNFLYFITRNLKDYFNQSNPHFMLSPWFFGQTFDLLKVCIGGAEVLYPPLFNKGAVGMMPDGSFTFGRVRLPNRGAVTVPIGSGGRTRRLEWQVVNPLQLATDTGIAIFTPMAEHCRDPRRPAPHVSGQTRSMYFTPETADRYQFVMINDRLLGAVCGRTEIPPFGTVLSVPAEFFNSDERSLLDSTAAATQPDAVRLACDGQTRVQWEFAIGPCWAGAEWIMGGALLMVDEGQTGELRHAALTSEESVYRLEGWSLESSQRTQETPVETDLREARTTIGLTADGQFFLAVIEGRANNRLGASHVETVDCLQSYFRARGTELRYALDLDSASSVALGVAISGQLWLLNQTARGSDSKLGDTRYFNHLAFLSDH